MMTCFSGPDTKIGGLAFLKSAAEASRVWAVVPSASKLCSVIPPLFPTAQKPLHFCLSHIFTCSSERKKNGLLSFYGPIKDLPGFNLVSHRAFLY